MRRRRWLRRAPLRRSHHVAITVACGAAGGRRHLVTARPAAVTPPAGLRVVPFATEAAAARALGAGSLVRVGAIALLGARAFDRLGLLVAARAQTADGVSGLMNPVMRPMWIASGVFFSSEKFPAAVAARPGAPHPALRALLRRGRKHPSAYCRMVT